MNAEQYPWVPKEVNTYMEKKYGCFPKLVTLFVGPKGRFKDPPGRVWTAPSRLVMSIIQWS